MSDYPSMSHVQHITFEGNDCVVMSPEEYGAALADLEAKDYELSALRAELTEARRQLAAQPAVPEAVAKVSAEEIIQKIIDYGYEKERGASCVYRYEAKQYDEEAASILNELRAILSATDSEVKK